MKDITIKGFRRVGPEKWRKNIRDKVEDHYWIADNLQEEYGGIIICVEGESNKSSKEERSNSGSDGSISSNGEQK